MTVGKAILESLSGDAEILDDIWEDGPDKCEQLGHSLLGGLPGSKILVTTRSEIVAGNMGCTRNNVLQDNEERARLESIGRYIVEKCDGLPLSAKALGSLLRLKSSVQEWSNVLDKLRQCFSYCAIFPEDYKIKKDQLIEMWMAQEIPSSISKLIHLRQLDLFGNLEMEKLPENGGNCHSSCEYLPPVWKLPSLEKLILEDMEGVKRLGVEFVGMETQSSSPVVGFPKLKHLIFNGMSNLEDWDSVAMSNLATILHCPKLNALPNYLLQMTTLEKLSIYECPILEQQESG
ncbi:putative disease resistance protein RGA3 [Ricinus communis]|uniref:putative disease resistance protein RGA3 n=1 Tax=Ricinus communis TaxID=3988 RepID=UPI00201B33BB|nr:putative disease resistance protein RGA3 [Ricinus communis]